MSGLHLRPTVRRWIGFVPVAVFLVSSALLLYWWGAITAAQGRAMQDHFELDARRVATKLSERLEAYDEILRGTAGLFAASTGVSRNEFRRFIDEVWRGNTYRGIQGVGFSLAIPPDRLAAHVASVRSEGFPDYEVRPPGPRELYTSIVYLEPFSGRNLRAFGYDMFSEPVRRDAMAAARDTGEPATSGRVRLVQETEEDVQAGFLIYQPVYAGGQNPPTEPDRRRELLGWAYMPMRMNDSMQGIMDGEQLPFRLEIFDGPDAAPEHLLHDSRPGGVGSVELAHLVPLPVNQRTWTLRFTAGDTYVAAIRQRSPAVEFGLMTLVAFLLTGLSAAAVGSWRSRQRALDLSISLQESEARWRRTFERAPVGICTVDARQRFLRVNQRYCEITGFGPEELARMQRPEVVHPEDRAADAEVVRRVRTGEVEVGTLERRGVRKDGTTFWAEITLSLDPASPGTAPGMIGVLDDVTARHEAEAKFREIAERSLAGILILQDGMVAYANPILAELVGRKPGEVEGKSADWLREHIHPDDLPSVRAAALEAGAEVAGTARPIAYRVVSSGTTRTLQQTARQIQHLGRPAMLVTLVDVSERERMLEELRKAQRLESLGLVAGGIAHDFNNLLTAVFGQVELARGHVDGTSPAASELDVALSALARSRDLTRQLLTFATGGTPSRKVLRVPRLLEEAVRLGLGGSSVRARFEVEPDLPPIEADEGQMSQLWNNLLVNARQAMSGAGEVVVRARRRTLQENEIPGVGPGLHVEVSVQDPGHGIPPEVLPKVFDPFFTTREKGTGLGLATSYSIVRRHGGHVEIASRVGEGTTVTVLLPAAPGTPEADVPAPGVATSLRKLRVLLMDDEPLVLKVGAKHFRKLGLEVETASEGSEAVELFRRNRAAGHPFDLVVLDLTVSGGMGGAQAVQRMLEIDPGVVAIACSGYFDDAVMARPGQFGFAGVLAKPYLTADLERVLSKVAAKER